VVSDFAASLSVKNNFIDSYGAIVRNVLAHIHSFNPIAIVGRQAFFCLQNYLKVYVAVW
jgi:hypothetical protein